MGGLEVTDQGLVVVIVILHNREQEMVAPQYRIISGCSQTSTDTSFNPSQIPDNRLDTLFF